MNNICIYSGYFPPEADPPSAEDFRLLIFSIANFRFSISKQSKNKNPNSKIACRYLQANCLQPIRLNSYMRIFAMLATRLAWLVGLLWFGVLALRADTHYVATSALSVSPYTSWGDAASNIEWAVSVATNGETVLVSNGTYTLTNQVEIRSNITVRSFAEQGHGTNDTIVNGNYPAYTNRCFYMTNGVLNGLMISNGYAGPSTGGIGGGVYIINANVSVYNCYFYKNYCSNDSAANYGGGGIYMTGGTISNCTVRGNIVYEGTTASTALGGGIYPNGVSLIVASYISGNKAYNGGGIYSVNNGTITNCTIADNLASNRYGGMRISYSNVRNCLISNNVAGVAEGTSDPKGDDGGINLGIGGTIYDSIIISNRGSHYNGGLTLIEGAIASNCQIIGNSSGWNAGGVSINGDATYHSLLVNCVVRENTSGNGNGAGVQQANATTRNCLIISNKVGYGLSGQESLTPGFSVFENCTVVGNAKGLWLQTGTSTVRNCIIYSNAASEIVIPATSGSNNCRNICTSPSGIASLPLNHGNFTNNPMFVDWVNGNYRLLANSPCVNAGANQSWMTNGVDLDGRTRIRYGTVDLGPYELIHSATIYGFR